MEISSELLRSRTKTTGCKNKVPFRIALLGGCMDAPMGVGKTSLLTRYMYNRYPKDYTPSRGVDITIKHLTVDDEPLQIQLLEFSRNVEHTRSLGRGLYKTLSCCILVFDVGSKVSFQALDGWRDVVLEGAGNEMSVPFILIGNKVDGHFGVSRSEIDEWCSKVAGGVVYVETSAKNDTNVEHAFRMAIEKAMFMYKWKDLKF